VGASPRFAGSCRRGRDRMARRVATASESGGGTKPEGMLGSDAYALPTS
jgi:hypothetical protein